MFRARNNVLPKNLQLLYKAKYHNENMFYRIKVRTAVDQITPTNKKHY